MRIRIKDRNEPVHGVEGEGGDGGLVAGAEEGGLEEKEEEEGDTGIAQRKDAVGVGIACLFERIWRQDCHGF